MLLENQIISLKHAINHLDTSRKEISEQGVDWHIDHSLKVILKICEALKTSNPSDYKWKFNFVRFIILTKGSIPRGKGKAPKSVIPVGKITREELSRELENAKQQLQEINNLPKKSNFKHPYFGFLDLKTTKRFLAVHTDHHIKIIQDIIDK